jgi:hypothetical protein
MSELALDAMKSLLERHEDIAKHFPKMTVTVVTIRNEAGLPAFKKAYESKYGEHTQYTLSEWIKLDTAQKEALHGKNVLLVKTRNEPIGLHGNIIFLSRRFFVQRTGQFYCMRDATGLSGQPFEVNV